MLIKNCKVIYLDSIKTGNVLIEDGKISKISEADIPYSKDDIIDGKGLYLSPGFIDVHIHGANGCDTMDGKYDSINKISETIVKYGTTSFLPTTMTCSIADIYTSVNSINEAMESGTKGAQVLGVHLEGPFINSKMLGAQNPEYVLEPTIENFKKLVGEHESIVKSITLAPEVKGSQELIEYLVSKNILVSIGHSKATYNETVESFKLGVSHGTHLFNAMTPLHHRDGGVVGAILNNENITTETICDGIHISFPVINLAYKLKAPDKMLLVTDAIMACTLKDGIYSLGGQEVIVKNGEARIKTGSLAGSVLTLNMAVKNVKNNTPYPLHEIVKMATYNPAKHCKVDDRKGLIKEGYDADLVIFDEDINIQYSIINGEVIYKS